MASFFIFGLTHTSASEVAEFRSICGILGELRDLSGAPKFQYKRAVYGAVWVFWYIICACIMHVHACVEVIIYTNVFFLVLNSFSLQFNSQHDVY